jgi:hypothetical protein
MAKRTIWQRMPVNFVVVFVMNTNGTEPHRLNTCAGGVRARCGSAYAASRERRRGASDVGPDSVYYAPRDLERFELKSPVRA